MPINPPPPAGVIRPRAPAAPPGTGYIKPPAPIRPTRPPVRIIKDDPPRWYVVVLGWIVFSGLVTFVGFAINKSLDDAQVKVVQWSKETAYKKCTGEFNTLSCHQRLSREREKLYKEYEGQ